MDKSFKKMGWPYIGWLFLFALFPILFMFILSFMNTVQADFSKPFSFTLQHFNNLFSASTLLSFGTSFMYAGITMLITLVLGYMIAYTIFRSKIKNKFMVLTIFIMPMWSNMLLRMTMLRSLMLEHNLFTSIINNWFGTDLTFIKLTGTSIGVIIGLVLMYLPFMILPIYNALEKMDVALEEAALDLGLTDFQKFWKVIFPLSLKGVATGAILVFLPSMSGFAIPEIIGDGHIVLIGSKIQVAFFNNNNYNLVSLYSIVLLIVILGGLFIVSKVDKEGEMLL